MLIITFVSAMPLLSSAASAISKHSPVAKVTLRCDSSQRIHTFIYPTINLKLVLVLILCFLVRDPDET